MSSLEELKTFHKDSRAATQRGAGRARCGLHEHGRQQEQAPPEMWTGQSAQACLRREVPTDHEAHSQSQRRQLRRVATTELRRDCSLEAEAEHRAQSHPNSGPQQSGPEKDCDEDPEQPISGNTDLHAQNREERRVVLVSPEDHAQRSEVCAEEQRVSEHAERNTWVSTWTSEQLQPRR